MITFSYSQNEHEKLRQRINEIVNSNEAPCNDDVYAKLTQAEANFQSYKQISTDAINNLKGQIEYINTVSLFYAKIGAILLSLARHIAKQHTFVFFSTQSI